MKVNKLTPNIKKYRAQLKFRSRFLYAKYEKGLSGKRLAEIMGVDPSYISLMLKGHRSPQETLERAIAIVTRYSEKIQEKR